MRRKSKFTLIITLLKNLIMSSFVMTAPLILAYERKHISSQVSYEAQMTRAEYEQLKAGDYKPTLSLKIRQNI